MFTATNAYGLRFTTIAADTMIGRALAVHGEFARIELDLIEAYLQHLGGRGVYLDVGANIGTLSLPLARKFPQLRIVAIEANRNVANVLAANVVNNGLAGVEVIHAVAGSGPGIGQFPTPPLTTSFNYGNLGMHLLGRMPTEPVRITTLDETAPDDTLLVKLDVEGHEAEVLAGAQRVLQQVRPVWVAEANPNAREHTASVMQLFLEHGYRLFWLLTPFITPFPLRGPPRKFSMVDLNFVALPPGVDNIWDLPQFHSPADPWVTERAAYPYFARYNQPSEPAQ